MLRLEVPYCEMYDEERNLFIPVKACTLQLEHSLVSLSKWESRWHKPFMSNKDRTDEEAIDYIRCMTLTQNVDPNVYYCLKKDDLDKIKAYIDDPMTATRIKLDNHGSHSSEVPTAELIYYWMVTYNIPFECQKWHLHRLLTLINVCNEKNKPPKKMGKKSIMSQNAALNAARRQALNSRG